MRSAVINPCNMTESLHRWGELLYGKCGLRAKGLRLFPERIPTPEPVKLIACGEQHTALVGVSGRLYTFGSGLQVRVPLLAPRVAHGRGRRGVWVWARNTTMSSRSMCVRPCAAVCVCV
jgi:hypothetical protein